MRWGQPFLIEAIFKPADNTDHRQLVQFPLAIRYHAYPLLDFLNHHLLTFAKSTRQWILR